MSDFVDAGAAITTATTIASDPGPTAPFGDSARGDVAAPSRRRPIGPPPPLPDPDHDIFEKVMK